MSGVGEIISLVGGTALIVFLLVYWFSKTEDRVDLVIRWIGTLALIAYFRYVVAPYFQPLSRASIVGVGLAAMGVLSRLQSAPMSASRNHRACNFPLSSFHRLPENFVPVFYRYPRPTKGCPSRTNPERDPERLG